MNVSSGILTTKLQYRVDDSAHKSEWKIIRNDLSGRLALEELDTYYQMDLAACNSGNRILYIPTFYAIGQVP